MSNNNIWNQFKMSRRIILVLIILFINCKKNNSKIYLTQNNYIEISKFLDLTFILGDDSRGDLILNNNSGKEILIDTTKIGLNYHINVLCDDVYDSKYPYAASSSLPTFLCNDINFHSRKIKNGSNNVTKIFIINYLHKIKEDIITLSYDLDRKIKNDIININIRFTMSIMCYMSKTVHIETNPVYIKYNLKEEKIYSIDNAIK